MKAFSAASTPVKSFLDFCRVEQGLSANSIQAYHLDLKRFNERMQAPVEASGEDLSRYVGSLYAAGLSPRSPKFAKRYADIASVLRTAATDFAADVTSGAFPTEEYSYR